VGFVDTIYTKRCREETSR